jgi:hypothetical protein
MQNPQYQGTLPPKKTGLSTPLIILLVMLGSCVLCGLIAVIGSLFQKDKPASIAQTNANAVTATPLLDTKPTVKNPSASVAVSNITWSDYNNVYNLKSDWTDIQKDTLWEQFEGKTIAWQGTVYKVREGMLGGLSVSIKMDPETMTSDILLTLKDDQKAKAINLTKGQKISFVGKLKSYGGAVLPLMLDEGRLNNE